MLVRSPPITPIAQNIAWWGLGQLRWGLSLDELAEIHPAPLIHGEKPGTGPHREVLNDDAVLSALVTNQSLEALT